MPVYDEKYMKVKVKEFNGAINTNFWGDEVPKEVCITLVKVFILL